MDLHDIQAPEERRKQGRPYVSVLKKWANPTMMDCLKSLYERIAERHRKYNSSIYRKKDKIIEKIANKYLKSKTDEERLKNIESLISHINHSKKHRTTKKKK